MNVNVQRFLIDGDWRSGDELPPLEDLNPATGDVFAMVAQAGRAEALEAVDAAHWAARGWGATLASEREGLLIGAADVLARRVDEIAQVIIAESGSSLPKAMFEVHYCIDLLRMAAGEVRQVFGETLLQTMPGQFGFTLRRPLGVIAGIAPFNAPFLLAMKKVALALAAGNAFVLKPSEETPVTGIKIGEVFTEAGFPAGVLNVVTGQAAPIGEALTSDPRVAMITFTGSTRVGRYLAVEAARHLKRFTLEMGGKNPLIVLDDADLDYAVGCACFGIFFHQGQVCMAGSRLIVEDGVYDAFCEAFAAKAATYKVGDPSDPTVVVGPLIRASQCEFIQAQVEDARAHGAKVLTGGSYEGHFYQPTVIADVTEEMDIFRTETFGPVVSIVRARYADHALALANDNDNDYGLSSAVFTNDLQRALSMSMELEAGLMHVNSPIVSDEPHVPFGGIKNSGFGREGGRYSIAEMTELKWVTMQMGRQTLPF